MKNILETALYYSVRYSALILPILVVAGIIKGGIWTYTGAFMIFGYYFLVEFILWISGIGLTTSKTDEFKFSNPNKVTFIDRYGLVFFGILQLSMLPVALYYLSRGTLSTSELTGGVISLVVIFGSVGGLTGHEYIHRKVAWERMLGITIYTSMYYTHFTVSHLQGHHKNVGMTDDWSTSYRYESSYAFLFRTLVDGYKGAWALESRRLERLKKDFWSIDNFMIKASLAMLLVPIVIGLTLGWKAAGLHIIIGLLSASLMEMVNYLSHYGLVRKPTDDGKWETVTDRHSWETNNKVTNWFVFNAGKHCHHHRRPSEHHYNLELATGNEYIPFGLPLMTLISFVPPLYYRVMDNLIDGEENKKASPFEKVLT